MVANSRDDARTSYTLHSRGKGRSSIMDISHTTAFPSQADSPSGQQFEIHMGAHRCIITEVGADLRSFVVHDREILDTYGPGEMAAAGRGQVLLPWPGRIEDGQYTFEGAIHQVPLNEFPAHNAIHGLTRWSNWLPVIHESNRMVMT